MAGVDSLVTKPNAVWSPSARSALRKSMPVISGMFQSHRIRSGVSDRAVSRPMRPLSASSTVASPKPAWRRLRMTIIRIAFESSTTKIFTVLLRRALGGLRDNRRSSQEINQRRPDQSRRGGQGGLIGQVLRLQVDGDLGEIDIFQVRQLRRERQAVGHIASGQVIEPGLAGAQRALGGARLAASGVDGVDAGGGGRGELSRNTTAKIGGQLGENLEHVAVVGRRRTGG